MTFDFHEIAVSDVSRHFGRRRALSHVSFACQAGETVGLLGPNGAGKSTLLAILATLLAPSSGEVHYGDRTAAQAGPALRGRLGLLAHDLHLYPELTARENLEFFARLHASSGITARVARALVRAGLADRADDLVISFSRGMRQRLAFERALLHEPRLVLLDEPFTGLDEASAGSLVERLSGLRKAGCLALVATHDLDIAADVLDRAVVLRDGRVVDMIATGGPLRQRYKAATAK